MAEQREPTVSQSLRTSRARETQAPGAACAIGLRTTATAADNILAVAAIVDVAGLNRHLGLAGPPELEPARARRRLGRVTAQSINPVDVLRCRVIWRLVTELFAMACERDLPQGVGQRRPRCHVRQIAMYLSHVVLSVPYRTVARAFGRDRSTVVHACAVVEDRRDDAGYDRFVERCERCVDAVFAPRGHDHAEL